MGDLVGATLRCLSKTNFKARTNDGSPSGALKGGEGRAHYQRATDQSLYRAWDS